VARIDLPAGLRAETGSPWPGVRYFTTWRHGGASVAPFQSLNLGLHVSDDASRVLENRRRLRLGLPGEPVWLDQVHGTAVCDVDCAVVSCGLGLDPGPGPGPGPTPPPCADAAITMRRGRPLAILTADCLPVVLADQAGRVLGVAHAGWRGLLAGVLENTLAALRARQPLAQAWRAWIGPGIGPGAFEIGPEVRAQFLARDRQAARYFAPRPGSDRWLADLPGLAQDRLRRAGIDCIEVSEACTYTQSRRYFSYRRQARTGRQATVAWLEP